MTHSNDSTRSTTETADASAMDGQGPVDASAMDGQGQTETGDQRVADLEATLHVREAYVDDLEGEVARLRATTETLQSLLDTKEQRIERLERELGRLRE